MAGLGSSACDMHCACEHTGGDDDVCVCYGSRACAHGGGEGDERVECVARLELDGDDDHVHLGLVYWACELRVSTIVHACGVVPGRLLGTMITCVCASYT